MANRVWIELRLLPSLLVGGVLLSGCAVQAPPVKQMEATHSQEAQKRAQQAVAQAAPAKPSLKRKIAIGRLTNETNYGRSLLRDRNDDPLGKQVTDLLSKALTDSGSFLVFERPDIGRIKDEATLAGTQLNIIGVDALIIGSLTEFGRKVVGESGFLSQTKRQVAFAKIDLRLVDTRTGFTFFSAAGAGEASTESGSIAGFGSSASYDGTLNDAAIRQAVSEAVNKLSNELLAKPWQTYILKAEQNTVFIGGGKSQGLRPGMQFAVETKGQRIKSPQTGADITLPGRRVAEIRIDSTFGDTELNEGSVATIVTGTIQGMKTEELIVIERQN